MGERVECIVLEEEEPPPLDNISLEKKIYRWKMIAHISKWATIALIFISFIFSTYASDLVDEKMRMLWDKHSEADDTEGRLIWAILGFPEPTEKDLVMDQIGEMESIESFLPVFMISTVLIGLCIIIFTRARWPKASRIIQISSLLLILILIAKLFGSISRIWDVKAVPTWDLERGIWIMLLSLILCIPSIIICSISYDKIQEMRSSNSIQSP
jgi:hypothetical protein